MSEQPQATPFSRRRLLAMGAGVVAVSSMSGYGRRTLRPATTPPTAAASGDLPSLSQWYHQYGEAGTQEAVERYAAGYTKAKVSVNWQPDYDNVLPAALLTDGGPDVFENGNGASIDMIRSGQVVELTDLLSDEVKADFNQAVLARMSYQGKVYAIPQLVDMILLVYRKSMLTDAGVGVPTTIDEMIAAAKACTKGDVKGLFLGNDGGATEMGIPLLASAGLNYLTDDDKFGFDDPAAAEVFKKLQELYASGSLLEGQDKDWWSAEAFINGACAMQWTGLWTFPEISAALGDDWGCAAWPAYGAKGKPAVIFGAFGSCVNSKSAHVDVAKDFVKYLWVDGTDMQLDFNTAYGFHVPARASLLAQADTLKSGPAKDAADLLGSAGHAQNQMLWNGTMSTAFNDMMTRIVKDNADPVAEIATLKPLVEAELAKIAGDAAPAGTTA